MNPVAETLRACEVLIREKAPSMMRGETEQPDTAKFGRRMMPCEKARIRTMRFDRKLSYGQISRLTGWAKSNVQNACKP